MVLLFHKMEKMAVLVPVLLTQKLSLIILEI